MLHINRMLSLGLAAVCLSACGVEELNTTSGGGTGVAVAPTPTPSPPPAPIDTSQKQPGTISQLDRVDSGLNSSLLLSAKSIPGSAAPDNNGAFRFTCSASHLSYDDPIVHPGSPGAAHLHQFFGNTEANAHSTYESLRTTGGSSCMNELNRSAYWMPALLDGQGNAIVPDRLSIYYKRHPANSEFVRESGAIPMRLPRGLRYVFGAPTGEVVFKCADGWNDVPDSKGSMRNALSKCNAGQRLVVSVNSDFCWNGDLDSQDHRSHVVPMQVDPNTAKATCPSTHRYFIPKFTMTVSWPIADGDLPALWRFSSDPVGAEQGSTFHADWFGAWEDEVLEAWHNNCIDKLLNCSNGDLGDGRTMLKSKEHETGKGLARKVPVHSIAR